MNNFLKSLVFFSALLIPEYLYSGEKTDNEVVPIIETTGDVDTSQARPITGVYALEYGSKSVLATYLSPLKYTGTEIAANGSWSKAMPFNPAYAVMQFDGDVEMSSLLNPAGTARMIGLNASFSWGMAYRHRLPYGMQFTVGGALEATGGAYYLLRNGNNPIQAMAEASLNITASFSKTLKIKRLPILISDRVSLPSLGVFFCPGYGETYYEIYLGNHKGLVHPGWWGNNFRINNLLSLTLDFGKTAMMIGYRFEAYTQWANNLNTKIFNNSFVIGIIPGGIGLKKRPLRLPEESIYAIY